MLKRHFQVIALVIAMTVSVQIMFRYILPLPKANFTTEKLRELLQTEMVQENNETVTILNKFGLRRKHMDNICKNYAKVSKIMPKGKSLSR